MSQKAKIEVTEKETTKVLETIRKNPGCDRNFLIENTKMANIRVWAALKELQEFDKIRIEIVGNRKKGTYYIKKELETTKDISKVYFDGNAYNKCKFVLALVRQYVEDNPNIKLDELKKAFPDKLNARYGVVQKEEYAKEKNQRYRRFFSKPDQLIRLKDNTIVSVCSDFGKINIVPVIKRGIQLGYNIEYNFAANEIKEKKKQVELT